MIYTPPKKPGPQLRFFGPKINTCITIKHKTFMEYQHLVQEVSPNEVQWYAFVDKKIIPGDQNESDLWCYHIDGLIIPKQTVSPNEVDTSVKDNPMTMMCIYQELKNTHADNSEFGYNQDAVNRDITRMHVWCHSHPFSEKPVPSGTDDFQFKTWVQNNQLAQKINTPMVALIFGKGTQIHARAYDPSRPGIYLDTIPVVICPPTDLDTGYIDEAIKTKITKQNKSVYCGAWLPNQTGQSAWDYRNGVWVKKHSSVTKKKKNPNKFFQKNFSGDWTTFIEDTNSADSNEEGIKSLWTFLCNFLKDDLQRTIFTIALIEPFGTLQQLQNGLRTEQILNKDNCLLALLGHWKTNLIHSEELKIVLTFTKHYSAMKNSESRKRAIENLIAKLTTFQENVFANDSFGISDLESIKTENTAIDIYRTLIEPKGKGSSFGYTPIDTRCL